MRRAGFVLVGGLSTRMGRDKALLASGSHLLIEDVSDKVAVAAGSVTLVGKPERYRHLGFDAIADARVDLGPLGGIEAALGSGRAELNLIVGCDMPGLKVDWLRGLLFAAENSGALCTVACDGSGTVHPLCAVYHSGSLPVIEDALNQRRLRLLEVIAELRAQVVNIADMIWNVNTPDDWSAWRSASTHIKPGSTAKR